MRVNLDHPQEDVVPLSSDPLRKLGFLTIGLFDEAVPRLGHNSTLELIELGEQLGFDSAWVRHRHLQYGISSPVAVLAAASQWAGEHGTNFLTSSVVKAEESENFAEIQLSHIRVFRAHHPDGDRARVSQGLVVIPTDTASPEQRAKYEEYARKRMPRTATPQGPARMMFAPDLVGASGKIAERLYSHAAFREIDEVAFALPFTFDHGDYVQILTDIATKLGPALGWRPTL
jgi:alkanesulfonate monooxygenase SsuD/methylene tetrahydromethanopterin reductase-like flavin-dependent oxidoreductase (luciferase family)